MDSILLISKDITLIDEIKSIFKYEKFNIFEADYSNILLSIYKHDPIYILIDLEQCSEAALIDLKDFREIDYIPITGITPISASSLNANYSFIKSLIDRVHVKACLLDLFNGLIDLKLQYDVVKESNDAVDKISSEIDNLFKNNSYSVKSLLESIFSKESFLHNKPAIVLILYLEKNKLYFYKNANGKIYFDKVIDIVNISIENYISIEKEFFANCNLRQFSDIDNYKIILKNILKDNDIDIENFAGYITNKTGIIAVNYAEDASSLEAKIIKALCVNLNLIRSVYDKVDEVNEAFIYTIEALARAGEAADDDTGGHIKRVNEYSKFLSELLGMDPEFTQQIYYSAQMHDVGKIHIPHSILKKNGSLTAEEFATMKEHTIYGPKIIGNSPHLKLASDIALNHHEKYDGSGYPYGVKGEDIPIAARIVALADVYDALRNPRVYKPPFSHEKTVEIITIGDGRVMPQHFDPHILELFKNNNKFFNEIWNTFQ
jgi:Response regulator containing a CheY-like receiver domain and an HD-GYP domain